MTSITDLASIAVGKAQLDDVIGQVADAFRSQAPGPREAAYADHVAALLAVQFGGTPDLGRIALACAQYTNALSAGGVHPASLMLILARAGVRLTDSPAEAAGAGPARAADPRVKLTFEIEALEDGESLDQADVLVFLRCLNDLPSHADFPFRIGPVEAAPTAAN